MRSVPVSKCHVLAGEERLEAMMLISMHGQERLNVDKAVDKFMKLQARRC